MDGNGVVGVIDTMVGTSQKRIMKRNVKETRFLGNSILLTWREENIQA